MYLRIINLRRGEKQYKYLKLVETTRYKKKIIQKTLLNFGNVDQWPEEKLNELVFHLNEFCNLNLAPRMEDVDVHDAFDFGACFAVDSIWKELNMSDTIRHHMKEHTCDIDIVPPVKAMVFNRILEPSSKLRVSEWVTTQAIHEIYPNRIPLHHYYRSLDYLMAHKASLEEDIFWKANDIFNLDLSLVFYDLTSSYFEGNSSDIAKHGYSRDHRPDCRQIEIGLLVNREGIPIAHEVWEGNIKDQKTVPDALETLKNRFNVKRCVFVGDNAMATPENITLLRDKNYEYITSLKLLKDSRALALLKNPSLPDYEHFTKLKDNLYIHEVTSPCAGFHDDERIIICYNPERAYATSQKREEKLTKSRKYLQSIIDTPPQRGRRKKPEKVIAMVERNLRKMFTYKYFTCTFARDNVFEYHDNLTTLDHAQRTDGICMLLTNSSQLTPQEVALGYRTLSEVEHAFKEIKNFLKIRPIYHYKDLRVRGHVFICVLAYLVEKFIEKKLKQLQLTISTQKALQKLKPIRMVRYTIMNKSLQKITNINAEQNEIFNSLGISEIPKIPLF
jgi:transposase